MYTAPQIEAHVREHYGYVVRGTETFRGGKVNSSFKIETDHGAFVLRIYEEKTAEEILCELSILEALRTVGFPSPVLVPTRSGALATDFENKPSILATFIPGDVAGSLNTDQLRVVGLLLARMHTIPAATVSCAKKTVWEGESLSMLFVKHRELFLDSEIPGFDVVVDFFETHHASFVFPPTLPTGITHQDTKKENIILRGGTVTGIIDFDNAYYGTFLHDMMTTLLWEGYDGSRLSFDRCYAFMSGYQSVRKLTLVERDSLVAAFKYRLVREVFIGPFAAVRDKEHAVAASLQCMERFIDFTNEDERVLLKSIE